MLPIAATNERLDYRGYDFSPGVEIADPGHVITVEWATVIGATSVEVGSALLRLRPSVFVETVEDVPFNPDGSGWSITIPANRRVAALGLQGFRRPGESDITSASNIPGSRKISVAFPPVSGGGFDTPRFSVPSVGKQGAVPRTLTGAIYSGGTLALVPATAASRTRIALVSGDTPNEFSDDPTELAEVSVTTHATARSMQVLGPSSEVLWESPEFVPEAPEAEVDLKHALSVAFNAAIGEGQALLAEVTVRADTPAKAVVDFEGAAGSVLRTQEGVLRTAIEGDPVTLALSGPLDPSTPSSVTADLTIRYDGIRIHEEASDELPSLGSPVQGVIVGGQSALHVFPPQAFTGIEPARIGVYGRAPESCEISIEFVEMLGGSAGAALGPPATLRIEPDGEVKTRWAELPAGIVIEKPAGLRVRANTGRFYWAAKTTSEPIVRVAIFDPDPAGRPVYLGSALLANVHVTESHQPAFSPAPSVFAGEIPALRSDLFLTVDFSDLTLRYAR